MNKEQFIDTLQACYFGDKGAFNKILKEYEELHNKIDKVIKRIELLGKFDGEHCTRNFKMMSADFNYLLEILKDSDVE